MQALDRVFDDDDGGIDDQTDRNGEAAEAHEVRGHSERPHHGEGDERRERECERDNDGGAEVSKKDEKEKNDENGGL
jgi:hypothetical protein